MWQTKKLGEIIKLEYGKPLPQSSRTSNGSYAVYGANGIKNRSNTFYVDRPSIVVGRKGSAGALNLTEGKFWPLDVTYFITFDEKKHDLKFIYWLLSKQNLPSLGRGVKPGLNRNDVYSITVRIPESIDEQRKIVRILDQADSLRQKRQKAISLLDDYLKAVFLEMFGDPVTNPKGIKTAKIKELGDVVTGNTPSRKSPENYGDFIEWIKSDNINNHHHYLTKARENLSEIGLKKGRSVSKGAILVTCIAGSLKCIGNVSMTNKEVAFNQQINAIVPNPEIESSFLYSQILFGKKMFRKASTNSMKGMLNKGKFSDIKLLNPDTSLQKQYSIFFDKTYSLKQTMLAQSQELDTQFQALMQLAFKGIL